MTPIHCVYLKSICLVDVDNISGCNLYPSWWQHAANLASYEQQDAHEFFISMLDGIHEKVEKDRRKPQSQGAFCPVPVSFHHFFMSRLCACYVKLGGVLQITKRAIKHLLS